MTELGGSERNTLEHYEVILQNIRDAVYTLDANGRITWVNQPAIDAFDIGYTRDELIGAPVTKVLDPTDIEKAVSIIQSLLRDPERHSNRCEVTINTAHGTEIPCELRIALLPFEDGEFQGTVGVLRDITERKQREQRLTVFNRLLRHNLRNDMSFILGPAEELESSLEGVERQRATRIRERAERLLSVAEKARRIQATLEHTDFERRPVDVGAIVSECVAAYRADHSDVEFRVEGPDDLRALANETLRDAIDELLDNAITHNESPRRVTIELSTDPEEGWITIAIQDNGSPIPDTEIAVLEDGSETQLEHGSGLGLWFVQWLVDHYGGQLSFERPPDGGNTVILQLQPVEP